MQTTFLSLQSCAVGSAQLKPSVAMLDILFRLSSLAADSIAFSPATCLCRYIMVYRLPLLLFLIAFLFFFHTFCLLVFLHFICLLLSVIVFSPFHSFLCFVFCLFYFYFPYFLPFVDFCNPYVF